MTRDNSPRRIPQLCVLAATLFLVPGQQGPTPSVPLVLVDATAARGLTRWTPTFASAFADLDNDGDDDLVVSNHRLGPVLYLNQGGHFVDRSEQLPPPTNDSHALTIYDLDGDRDRDIALAHGGGGLNNDFGSGAPNQLWENRLDDAGALAFEDVSAAAGIGRPAWRSRWFLPIPGADGIDLYLESQRRPGQPNRLLENLGGMHFRPTPSGALTREISSEGIDTSWDYDRDGIVDLFTIDGTRPRVYRGIAGGGFQHVHFRALADERLVNAVAVGDLNRDGCPDLYLGGRGGRGDTILVADPSAASWHVGSIPTPFSGHGFDRSWHDPHDEWTRSVAMVDLDANGWLDIVVIRGGPSGEPNGSRFVLMSDGANFDRHDLPDAAGGQADDIVVGFVDGDRRPDLFVTNGWGGGPTNVGPYELWLNRTPATHRQLTVRLVGTAPNTDALGAQVELVDDAGDLVGYRMVAPRGQAQDTSRLHFGVGALGGPFRIDVTWADGSRQARDVSPGQDITITQQDR